MPLELAEAIGYKEREWLTRKEAATYLGKIGCPVSVRTLLNYARDYNLGKGPAFYKIRGYSIRYKTSDLRAWASKQVERIE